MIIYAKDYYSRNSIEVRAGEEYLFRVEPGQKWVDFFIPTSVLGFNNILLKEKKKRLKGVKCFALCGTIDKNEEDHFYIGDQLQWTAPKDGNLHFFANDHINCFFYKNNWGKIELNIDRI